MCVCVHVCVHMCMHVMLQDCSCLWSVMLLYLCLPLPPFPSHNQSGKLRPQADNCGPYSQFAASLVCDLEMLLTTLKFSFTCKNGNLSVLWDGMIILPRVGEDLKKVPERKIKGPQLRPLGS